MFGMVEIFVFLGVAGYVLVHFSNTIRSLPASRAVRTASSISATVAMPVDTIIGFPVRATRAISGRSVTSNEAIL